MHYLVLIFSAMTARHLLGYGSVLPWVHLDAGCQYCSLSRWSPAWSTLTLALYIFWCQAQGHPSRHILCFIYSCVCNQVFATLSRRLTSWFASELSKMVWLAGLENNVSHHLYIDMKYWLRYIVPKSRYIMIQCALFAHVCSNSYSLCDPWHSCHTSGHQSSASWRYRWVCHSLVPEMYLEVLIKSLLPSNLHFSSYISSHGFILLVTLFWIVAGDGTLKGEGFHPVLRSCVQLCRMWHPVFTVAFPCIICWLRFRVIIVWQWNLYLPHHISNLF